MNMSKIGIIAGGGNLPKQLINHCTNQNIPFFVVGMHGQTDPALLNDTPHVWTHLGQTSKTIKAMKAQDVKRLVMVGGVRRPALTEIRPDMRTLKLFTRLGKRAFGDDALLRAIAGELESEGFEIVGAHDVLPNILIEKGVLGKHKPNKAQQRDIERGIEVATNLGQLDVGQSVVVQQGIVLGVEAVEGTDALLSRCTDLKRKGAGGVLVKITKPQQDKRLDLPTMGIRTIENAIDAGLSGVTLTAGGGLLLDREDMIKLADKAGLFLMGI